MKALVLLSSGLDSTVNLYRAVKEYDVIQVLTFDYGQRAAKKEIQRSTEICKLLNLNHKVIPLNFINDLNRSSLVNLEQTVPTEMDIDNAKECGESAKSVWVPNRNGVFLNIAAAVAEGQGAQFIIPGFNKEEAATFPDNSQEYLDSLDHAFSFSTMTKVKTKCFTTNLNKTEIANMGKELEVPFELLWPCYFDEEELCGKCESCLRFDRAIKESGAKS